MKVHISLNVKDINSSVSFYEKMLAAEPVKFITGKSESHSVIVEGAEQGAEKPKSGYAKFDIANPPLNLALNEVKVEAGGSLSHLGLQVESTEDVLNFKKRWEESGLLTVDEMDVNCCYAKQDKTWVRDPDGNEWEAFVVLEDLATMEADETGCCDPGMKLTDRVVNKISDKVLGSCCG